MRQAFGQARDYVFDLPDDHPAPPFLIVCDVSHMFEVYADFSGTGRNYSYFPDRKTYRVYLEEFNTPEIRARFKAIWDTPFDLDPARRKERATRDIAGELAGVACALERAGHSKLDVAKFLMRCIFVMYACSVGLFPENAFSSLLRECLRNPRIFAPIMHDLWVKLCDLAPEARYFHAFGAYLPYFGPSIFKGETYALSAEHLAVLLRASERSWAEVEPAVFGSLLEEALSVDDRRRLGAHFTPREHVDRLVHATLIEPLLADWRRALGRVLILQELHARLDALTAEAYGWPPISTRPPCLQTSLG